MRGPPSKPKDSQRRWITVELGHWVMDCTGYAAVGRHPFRVIIRPGAAACW
jgi:hypothetical protein